MGRSGRLPGATRITAPSIMNAWLSERSASSGAVDVEPSMARRSGSPSRSAAASETAVAASPSSLRSARSRPLTKTSMRQSMPSIRKGLSAALSMFSASARASGNADWPSARRLVYFQLSSRGVGMPLSRKAWNAERRCAPQPIDLGAWQRRHGRGEFLGVGVEHAHAAAASYAAYPSRSSVSASSLSPEATMRPPLRT